MRDDGLSYVFGKMGQIYRRWAVLFRHVQVGGELNKMHWVDVAAKFFYINRCILPFYFTFHGVRMRGIVMNTT